MNKIERQEQQLMQHIRQKRWNECLQLAEQLRKESGEKRLLQLAEQAYCAVLADPARRDDRCALQGLASLYYRDYMVRFTSRPFGALPYDKQECFQKARDTLELLLEKGRQPEQLYRYAQILYRNAKDGQGQGDFAALCRQKEQAYRVYDETVSLLEKWGPADKGLYCRACYGLSRCGLESFSLNSFVLEELMLVFSVPSSVYGNRGGHLARLRRIYDCLERVLEIEGLPRHIEDMAAVIQAKQAYEKSWDIYYLLGKLFDCAGQFSLCHNKESARRLAERYYSYACEIDAARRRAQQRVPGFQHMYTALLTFYQRHRREDQFYAAWEQYHPLVGFSAEFHFLSQARWLIIRKEYEAARHYLAAQLQERQWSHSVVRRAVVLQDMVQVAISGSTTGLQGIYKPFQMQQLDKISRQEPYMSLCRG
ncbi:hypothetical protein [Megasphaera stantonii]|uniref:hypothetical protein n=1 Tax=Megasphaera stantonii TaxID=2144175 RepID=UPI0029437266|nr:hypothetical protein [Megasphaera stantonii]